MRRTVPLIALAAAAALLLSACSGGGGSKSDSTPKPKASASTSASPAAFSCDVKSGQQSDSITVSGSLGAEPKVTLPKTVTAKSAQRTITTTGTGTKVQSGATAFAEFAVYNGTTGKELDAEGFGGPAFSFTAGTGQALPLFDHMFDCVPVGSRVVLTEPASTAFGAGADPTQLGLAATDTAVFIGDLVYVAPDLPASSKADGAAQPAKAGFPAVKLDASGTPAVTIGKATKPTTTQIEVLKKGTGAVVKSGDFVSTQYQGVEFASGKTFDQSWGRGVATFQTNGVVAGFTKALVGQTVGSQVVAVIPPAEGYGANPPQGQSIITSSSTLVFVVDILQTAAAAK
ncbi:MAG TPA: FKBP-type peptidyl-prolyl cis-trans isomerase [Gryllotalpicola sp.]